MGGCKEEWHEQVKIVTLVEYDMGYQNKEADII